MSRMRGAALLLSVLLIQSMAPLGSATTGRATNIDLAVDTISISYTSSTNSSMYQMFSSNHPIANFNRPADLYVTDGVINVEMEIEVVIQNLGTTQSGFVDFDIVVLHDEYQRFELLNQTQTMQPINGGASGSVSILWTPTYSGNHSMQISVSNSNGEDNPADNSKNRHLTVAYHYDNCVDLSTWTVGTQWVSSTDTSISQARSCHVGNGQYSTYSSNLNTQLILPVMDLSDGLAGHNRAVGISFFYSGGAGTGDTLKGHVKDSQGNWDELYTIQGVVDNNFQDGQNWQTFSSDYNGHRSPLVPIANEHLHSQTQFRFQFQSDASGEDIGYWVDDIVIIYDQAARKTEYDVSLGGLQTLGGLPGEWSTTSMRVTNTGNISARYTPTVTGVPSGWQYYFANPNGASIGSSGLLLLPGQNYDFDLRVLVDENASMGNQPVTVNITSNAYPDIEDGIETIVKILADRIPDVIVPEIMARCTPGNTCEFPVLVANIGEATDVFTLSVADKTMPSGWSMNLAWNQSNNILVRTDSPVEIWLTGTIPAGVETDSTANVYLTATSTNGSMKSDTEVIEIAAAMISNASVDINENMRDVDHIIEAGDIVDVSFTIWNNASRMDVFRPSISATAIGGWSTELLNTPDLAINPGKTSSFTVRITAPAHAQAGDPGPIITPSVLSLRSYTTISGPDWQHITVDTLHDLLIETELAPQRLSPGTANHFQFKVTNNGNGPATAILDLPFSPDTWGWWALADGENVTEGIPLSVSYDLENIKIIDVWLLLPSLEAAGELHEITFSVSPEGGEDTVVEDNSVMVEALTNTVRRPELDGFGIEVVVRTDSTHFMNATAWNIGNAADGTIRARIVIETSPPSTGVIGFLSTSDGGSAEAGSWIILNLGPTESVELMGEVMIMPSVELNTRISVRLELEGGSDELGRPILKTITDMVMVGERRNVEIPELVDSEVPVKDGGKHLIWVNLSSTSTQPEIIYVNATLPDGWGILCDGNAIHLSELRIELDAGHLTTQRYNMQCEIIRESGEFDGDVIIEVTSTDDEISDSLSAQLSWEIPAEPEGVLSTTHMIAIGGGILGLVVIFLLLRMRGSSDEEDEKEEIQLTQEAPSQGPPATAFAGPPASVAPVVETVDPAMAEYQRQLEEYNRQAAEYASWEAAQSSQQEPESL